MTNEEVIRELRHLSSILVEADCEDGTLNGENLYSIRLGFTTTLFDVIQEAISALEMLSPVRGFTDDLLDRGYTKGRLETLDEIEERVRAWNYSSSKRIPYAAIQEITKSMRGVKTNEEDRGRS